MATVSLFDVIDTYTIGNVLNFLSVSRENLRQIVGEQSSENYLDRLISDADFKHDGKISYGEFLQAFHRQKQELVNNIYHNEDHVALSAVSEESADDVLRRFGILGGLRRNLSRNKV